jgi:hypothetical protein
MTVSLPDLKLLGVIVEKKSGPAVKWHAKHLALLDRSFKGAPHANDAFLRLDTLELFTRYPTFYEHPSLLPEYRGFNAIVHAQTKRVKQFGVTLRLVDEKENYCTLVAQVSTKLKSEVGVQQMLRISFAQKTYPVLYLLDCFEFERDATWYMTMEHKEPPMTPAINSRSLLEYFKRFPALEGLEEVLA